MTSAEPLAVAGPRPLWSGAGVVTLVAALVLGVAATSLVVSSPQQAAADSLLSRLSTGAQAFGFLILAVTGAVLVQRAPSHRLGWLLSSAGLLQLLSLTVMGYAVLTSSTSSPPPSVALWATNWLWVPAQTVLLMVLLHFPTGRRPRGTFWRVVELAILGWGVVATGVTALLPGPLGATTLEHLDNPFGWQGAGEVLHALLSPMFLVLPFLTMTAAAALIWRWRQGAMVERQQLRWVGAAALLTVLAAPLVLLGTDSSEAPLAVAVLLLPSAIAVAVLRTRLWEMGVLARSVVSVGVTVLMLATAYLIGVRSATAQWIPLVLGLIVAAVCIPLHRLVRAGVDRFLFGVNGDPGRVAQDLRTQLHTGPLDTLHEVVDRLATTLRLGWVGIEGEAGEPLAAAGRRSGGGHQVHGVPVVTGGHRVGRLLVEERVPAEGLSPRDHRVLTEVATAAALVVRAVQTDRRLEESAARLRGVRGEERARLQRDLHDGLGPALGSIGMHAEAARNLLEADQPARADEQLVRIGAQAQDVVAEIRRLIEELRPTTLGEAGLAEAIHKAVEGAADGLEHSIRLELPESIDSRVEVAAYRIVVEAVRNAARHAAASSVSVEARVEAGDLVLRVTDDGLGLGGAPPGVGRRAMTERATELGGSVLVTDCPGGGTEVTARIPLDEGRTR